MDLEIENFVLCRWMILASAIGLDPECSTQIGQILKAAYSEPNRHYHTLAHIAALIDEFDPIQSLFEDSNVALLALFFHDIIYDPLRHDNEEKSANSLRQYLKDHLPQQRLERACRHVLYTRHHEMAGDSDTNLVSDLDMAILGASWPDYLLYAQGVYREYLPVYGSDAYIAGRINLFIEPTLKREQIFFTPSFFNLEKPARQNLSIELNLWRVGGFI